jgi:hypothetical protein
MKNDMSDALEKYKNLKKKKLTNNGSFTEQDEKAAKASLNPKMCKHCGKTTAGGKCNCGKY